MKLLLKICVVTIFLGGFVQVGNAVIEESAENPSTSVEIVECCVCKEVIKDTLRTIPVFECTHYVGHSLCHRCFDWLIEKKIETCPLCRSELTPDILRALLEQQPQIYIDENDSVGASADIFDLEEHVHVTISYRHHKNQRRKNERSTTQLYKTGLAK